MKDLYQRTVNISRMNNLRDPTSDITVLIDGQGDLGVTYRLRQCCCGSKKGPLIIFLALLVVAGIAVALVVFLMMSKCI